jgi:hypothetical protein
VSEIKVGDKVWVLCEVATVYRDRAYVYMDVRHHGAVFEAKVSDCRPVEPPVIEACTKTANEQLLQSLKDYPFGEPANPPEIPDGSSDPLAPSPCMDGIDADQFIEGVMEARGRTSDPINPSHYKQGGIECIEAIKAATGDGFIGYVWGNVIKYLWRWPKKGGVDDLKKARWYLDRLIQEVGE